MFPIRDSVPKYQTPVVVYWLIATNALVFLVQLGMTEPEAYRFAKNFGLIPYRFFLPDGSLHDWAGVIDMWPFLTATFLHGGWLHIIFNMWTLFIFGSTLESRLGSKQFLVFYLACGIASSYAHGFFNPLSPIPVIGASGAIAGVIGAYALRFPTAHITLLIPIVIVPFVFNIPALAYGAIWFGFQVFRGAWDALSPGTDAGIAWWAHIGGFMAGVALLPIFLLFAPSGRGPQRVHRGPWD